MLALSDRPSSLSALTLVGSVLALSVLGAGCSCTAPILDGDGGVDAGGVDAGRVDGGGVDGGGVDGGGIDGGGIDGGGIDGGGIDGGGIDGGGMDAGATDAGAITPGAVIVEVSTGEAIACVRYDDGAVYCWGDVSYGAGASVIVPPTRIAGVDAVHIAAGSQFACAITRAGSVVCWGTIRFGTTYTTPTVITGGHTALEGLSEIAAGQNHACVRGSGRVFCWGANHHGHLGDGTDVDSDTSVEAMLPAGISGATDIGLGQQHSCATQGNTIQCWGWSQSGQAGTASVNNLSPVTIAPFLADAPPTEVDGGSTFSCVRIAGQVGCWGSDANAEFGDGSPPTATRYAPVSLPGFGGAESLSVDGGVACIVRTTGTVSCWGDNRWSNVSGSTATVDAPTNVAGLPTTASQVSVGPATTCALLDDGDVWCWGFNGFGTLGNPTIPTGFTDPGARSSAPVQVTGLP